MARYKTYRARPGRIFRKSGLWCRYWYVGKQKVGISGYKSGPSGKKLVWMKKF